MVCVCGGGGVNDFTMIRFFGGRFLSADGLCDRLYIIICDASAQAKDEADFIDRTKASPGDGRTLWQLGIPPRSIQVDIASALEPLLFLSQRLQRMIGRKLARDEGC